MLGLETRKLASKSNSTLYQGWDRDGKDQATRWVQVIQDFLPPYLRISAVCGPQEQLLSELSYHMKILLWEIHLVSGSGALIIMWLGSSFSLQDIIVIYVM